MDDLEFWRTPAPVKRQYIDLESGQVHVRDNAARSKKALPLLCLHPAPLSGRSFTQLLEALAPTRFAVAPDMPGYGLSDGLKHKPSLTGATDTLLQLVSAAGLQKFAILSVSSAARLALETAFRAPQQIETLILIDPETPPPDLSMDLRPDGRHLQDYWANLETAFGADLPPALKQRNLAEALQSHPHQDGMLDVGGDTDIARALQTVAQPVHIISTGHTASGENVRHHRPDWGYGALDMKAGPVAEWINGILADRTAPPLPMSPRPVRLPQPSTVRRAYADSSYGQLHYRICEPLNPEHVPLTCFHASPQSGVIYENLLAAMGTDRIALASDTPGFGESDGPLSAPEIEDYALSMAAFLDRIGISQTDLLGFHTGSMTAVELARQRPDLIRRIVMVSAPVFTDEELADFRAHYKPVTYQANGSHNVAAWQSFWQWRGPAQSIENYARNNGLTLRGGPVKHWGHRAAFNYVLGETLGDVDQPILVLNPGDDLRAQTLRAEPLMQNGTILDIAPLSHGMFDDSTERVAMLLRGFLDGD